MIPLGWVKCLNCAKAHMRGFLHCPHCRTRSHLYPEQQVVEDEVPKATSGGASNAAEQEAAAAAVPVAATAEAAPVELVSEQGPEVAELPQGAHIEGADGEPEELTAADVAAGYTELSFAQLRAAAKERGLSAGGTAVELAARLAEHDAAPATPAAEAP